MTEAPAAQEPAAEEPAADSILQKVEGESASLFYIESGSGISAERNL